MGLDSFTDGVIPQHRTVVKLIDDRVDSDEWTDSPSPCDCVRRLAEVVLTDDKTKPVQQRFLDAREPVADAMGYDNKDSIYQPIAQLFDDESVYTRSTRLGSSTFLKRLRQTKTWSQCTRRSTRVAR